jgi:Glycoside hydrolase family 44
MPTRRSSSTQGLPILVLALPLILAGCGGGANPSPGGATPAAAAEGVTVTINPAQTHAISPYIYGINDGVTGAPTDLTFARRGGNRWTAYNWETNASNAGSDYLYQNDNYLSSSATPAEAVRGFIAGNQVSGMASLVTVQMQGLVAGDESGAVSTSNPPDLTRFKQVVDQKSSQSGAPFTTSPPTTDAYVYMDEFLWSLDQKFAGQSIFGLTPTTQHVFAQLDNEPELWNSTHLEVQGPHPITSDSYIAKTISLARALKDPFPDLVIFGPVHFGFGGIYNWQGELSATPSGSNWFPDKYLPAIKTASAAYGKPLVDVYDFHWYPEATDGSGHRITTLTSATLTDAQVQAIVQSPRSLWDTTYTESSWITGALGGPIYILGRLQSRIAAENPGMRLSITEYNNGGSQHIAGAIAQADNLGIFGAQGLFAANLWPLNSDEPYILAGFRAFRDFDGAHSSFGDTSVQATSSNPQTVAAYASTDSTKPGRVILVAINRSTSAQVTAIDGQPLSGTAHLYQMTAATAASQSPIQPVAVGTLTPAGSNLTVTLPPLSVTTIDVF